MKQKGILIVIMLILAVTSCKKESEMFSFYRKTDPRNLKTLKDGEFYSWAASDSALIRADYFLDVQGAVSSYGDSIIAYGHCWAEASKVALPSIGNQHDTIYNQDVLPGSSISFPSYLPNLEPDTKYNIRSFVVRSKGGVVDTAYNPVVSEIATLPAIDQWFEQLTDQKPSGARFDAVAFNLGDTIFFGTGNQGQNILTKDVNMYDPSTGKWQPLTDLINVRLPVSQQYRSNFTDGTGFALSFFEPSSQNTIKCIYFGLGDYEGNGSRDYKSNTMLEYDLDDGSWRETSVFSGGIRSGAVSFTIGSKAYVGTGASSVPMNDWHVFDPVADRDGDALTYGWQTIDKPGGINAVARTGAIAFSIGGRGYFGLGKAADGTFLKDFWEFRPNDDGTNGAWIKKADFPGEARENASAFVVGSQGYVGTGDNIVGDMEGGSYTGQIFSDVFRYDPFNNKWIEVKGYTINDLNEATKQPKKVTRSCGFSGKTYDFGFIGFGMVPDADPRAQEDMWKYQPWEAGQFIGN